MFDVSCIFIHFSRVFCESEQERLLHFFCGGLRLLIQVPRPTWFPQQQLDVKPATWDSGRQDVESKF